VESVTYFIQSPEGGPIKIGVSSTPRRRLKQLQTGSPVPLEIVGLIDGNVEDELHRQFAQCRKHGEWFDPTPELISYIQQKSGVSVNGSSLKMKQNPTKVTHAIKRSLGTDWFDQVHENNDDLYDWFLGGIPWDYDSIWSGDDEDEELSDDEIRELEKYSDEPCSEYDCAGSAFHVITGESFFSSVGVNVDAGYVGFICGPCNSRRRFNLLRALADVAGDFDNISDRWFLFATFWDGTKQIGINLLNLYITEGRDNQHLFDVNTLARSSAIVTEV
jgi:hypothetical protein